MRKHKFISKITAFFFCTAFLFAGCGDAGPEESPHIPAAAVQTAGPAPAQPVTALTLATIGSSAPLLEAVDSFNSENQNYQIILKDYLEAGFSDYEQAVEMLDFDMDQGMVPDIYAIMPKLAYHFSSAGAFADLYPFIDNDPMLSRDSFTGSLLSVLELEGALYSIPIGFTVKTAVGLSSRVGTEMKITVDKARATLGELPGGTLYFAGAITRNEYLRCAFEVSGSSFMDCYSGRRHFDSEDFVSMLQFAGELPEVWVSEIDPGARQLDQAVLLPVEIGSFETMAPEGREVTFCGFPVADGMNPGHAVISDEIEFAISAESENKDVLWNFIRRLLAEDAQYDQAKDRLARGNLHIPVNERAMLRMAEETLKPGREFYFESRTPSQDYVDQVIALFDSVQNVYRDVDVREDSYIGPVEQLILDGAAPYFDGSVTAAQAAANIQSEMRACLND